MDSFFTRYKNPLCLIAIVLAQAIMLAMQVPRPGQPEEDGRRATLLRQWMVALATPVERVTHNSGLRVRGLWTNYIDLRNTRRQNHDLQAEIARLRQEEAAFAEDAAQGRRLQALLDFRQHYIASTVAAQIIGSSGTDRSRVVYIDKGSADGLKPDQPVITPDGIVGKLRDVFPHSAQLLLINDPTSGAGVMLESSRIRGILHGSASGRVQINNLMADDRIKPGEKVVTSGGDMVYPRGLPVGIIESVAPDPEHPPFTAIAVKPTADLARIEEVLVVTGTQTGLSAAAQQDAASAEAAAAETRRAAQMAAERLPGATEPAAQDEASPSAAKTPDLPGGVPGIPNSGSPRPQPPLHPDRFSPGAAPSAEEMTPGAPKPKVQPEREP